MDTTGTLNKQRKSIRLDHVEAVTLGFISERYKYAPDAVVRMRSGRKDFIVINADIRRGKAKSSAGRKEAEQGDDRSHGKYKEKHKNKKNREDK